MNLIIILLLLVNIILICIHIAYRRQVSHICRQIAFLRKHETNKLLTTDVGDKEIIALVNEVNEMNDYCKAVIKEYKRKDQKLKKTITSLSHDIRTPLTSMDGYFQLLEETTDEEKRIQYMKIIEGRINCLKEMLEELFLYTKLQDDTYTLEMEEQPIGPIVCESLFSFYEEFKKEDMEPEISITEEPILVLCSKASLTRVIQNIIKNSLIHSKSKVSVSLYVEGDRVIFQCSNDVKNPEEIDISQIFERFYKADAARQNTSTGLGLSIAKELTERMDGTIKAELEDDEFIVRVIFAFRKNRITK